MNSIPVFIFFLILKIFIQKSQTSEQTKPTNENMSENYYTEADAISFKYEGQQRSWNSTSSHPDKANQESDGLNYNFISSKSNAHSYEKGGNYNFTHSFRHTEEKVVLIRDENSSIGSAFNENNVNYTLQDDDEELFDWRKREDTYVLTSPKQFPYSVLLIMLKEGADRGMCTGSIITDEWVLTASHCLSGADEVVVYAGGRSYQEYKYYAEGIIPVPSTAQVLRSVELIMTPIFKQSHSDADVGLVKVKGKFKMTDTVNTIPLVTTPWREAYHSYTPCNLTGFGVVQMGEKRKDDSHRKTYRLDVKSPCLCSFRLQIMFGTKEASRFICTKPKLDYGLCPGDSGGGLVCGGKIRGVAVQLVNLKDVELCDAVLLNKVQCGDMNTLSVFQADGFRKFFVFDLNSSWNVVSYFRISVSWSIRGLLKCLKEDICPFLPWINKYVKLFNSSEISPRCFVISDAPCVNVSKLLIFFSNTVMVLIKISLY